MRLQMARVHQLCTQPPVHCSGTAPDTPCIIKLRAQGQKTKSFRYQLMNQEGQDLYMQIEMNESGKQQQRYGLPVTRGEHEVITRIAKVNHCFRPGSLTRGKQYRAVKAH